MTNPTNIFIGAIRINSTDKMARISMGSTLQVGNHVNNKRVEGFGERNGDRGIFHQQKLLIDDSDIIDTSSEKFG